MTRRDADPLPPTLGDPPGHARNVGLPQFARGVSVQAVYAVLVLLMLPVLGPIAGAAVVWPSTRGGPGGLSGRAWASRVSLVLAWAGFFGVAASVYTTWLPPLAAAATGVALFALSSGSFLAFLRSLTRAHAPHTRGLRLGAWMVVMSSLAALALLTPLLFVPQPALALWALAMVPLSGVALVHAVVLWLAAGTFWDDDDLLLDRAVARARLLGVAAIWTPFGYQWSGAGALREWRVIADTARVPAALRFEVTVRGTRPAVIRKRADGESGGTSLSDPILGSTLHVSGIDSERADAMLVDVHEVLLPLIHGRSAVLERGVLRVDLYPEPPLDRPWLWMEATLHHMIAVSDIIEANVIGEDPRTDEVVARLQEISNQLSE